MTSALSSRTARSASAAMVWTAAVLVLLELQHRESAGAHRGAPRVEARELQPVFDQRHRPVQRGDHRVLVPQQARDVRGGLGDVDDRHVEQLLQPFPPVLAEARLETASYGSG